MSLVSFWRWVTRQKPKHEWKPSGFTYRPGMEKAADRYAAVPGPIAAARERLARHVISGGALIIEPGQTASTETPTLYDSEGRPVTPGVRVN